MAEFKGFGGKLKIGNQEIDLAAWEVKPGGLLHLPNGGLGSGWGSSAKAAKLAWLAWAWSMVRSRAFVARPRRPIGWLWPERN
jgi:hypothetical protein